MKRVLIAAAMLLSATVVKADEPKKYILNPDGSVSLEKRVEKVEDTAAKLAARVAELEKKLADLGKPAAVVKAAACEKCGDACACPACDGKSCPVPTKAADAPPEPGLVWYTLPGVGPGWCDAATVASHKAGTFRPNAPTPPAVVPAAFSSPTSCPNGRCPNQR